MSHANQQMLYHSGHGWKLETFGTLVSPLVEELHSNEVDSDEGSEHPEDEDNEVYAPLGTGNLWVTMKLKSKIPQFIPMLGRKVEIYYRGIDITCTNCYTDVHKRQYCPYSRVKWLEYVAGFIDDFDMRPELFGKWFALTETMHAERVERDRAELSNEQTAPEVVVGDGMPEAAYLTESGNKQAVLAPLQVGVRREEETTKGITPCNSEMAHSAIVVGVVAGAAVGMAGASYRDSPKFIKNVEGSNLDMSQVRRSSVTRTSNANYEDQEDLNLGEVRTKAGNRQTRLPAKPPAARGMARTGRKNN